MATNQPSSHGSSTCVIVFTVTTAVDGFDRSEVPTSVTLVLRIEATNAVGKTGASRGDRPRWPIYVRIVHEAIEILQMVRDGVTHNHETAYWIGTIVQKALTRLMETLA